jgi:hypothetical protein
MAGLIGDSVDNIRGVPGVGAKTATELLAQFGSVEGIYARLAEVKSESCVPAWRLQRDRPAEPTLIACGGSASIAPGEYLSPACGHRAASVVVCEMGFSDAAGATRTKPAHTGGPFMMAATNKGRATGLWRRLKALAAATLSRPARTGIDRQTMSRLVHISQLMLPPLRARQGLVLLGIVCACSDGIQAQTFAPQGSEFSLTGTSTEIRWRPLQYQHERSAWFGRTMASTPMAGASGRLSSHKFLAGGDPLR